MRSRSGRKPRTPPLRAAVSRGEVPPSVMEKLRQVDALVLDCDGVLTKGELTYDESGHRLLSFDVKDGAGIALLTHAGIPVGLLSGRPAGIAEARHRELGVRHFVGRCPDKAEGLAGICRDLGVYPDGCAYVGDDLADLPAFRLAGVSVAVADACPEVLARADWVTENNGGMGAVREVCEAILKARGRWDGIIERLAGPRGGGREGEG